MDSVQLPSQMCVSGAVGVLEKVQRCHCFKEPQEEYGGHLKVSFESSSSVFCSNFNQEKLRFQEMRKCFL